MTDPAKKGYIFALMGYLLGTLLIEIYQYFRNEGIGITTHFSAIGYAGVFIAGTFLASKFIKRNLVISDSWEEILKASGNLGTSATLSFGFLGLILLIKPIFLLLQENPILFGVAALVQIALTAAIGLLLPYADNYFSIRPGSFSSDLPYNKAIIVLGVFVVVKIFTWINIVRAWILYIINPENSLGPTFMPPLPLIVFVYILITVILYIISRHDEISNQNLPTRES